MPKIIKDFLLGNDINNKLKLIMFFNQYNIADIRESHFYEKDGLHFFNSEDTPLTAISIEGSKDAYQALFYKAANFAITKKNGESEYEMVINKQAAIFEHPRSLLEKKESEIESIEMRRDPNGGNDVTIIYENGKKEEKNFYPNEFEFDYVYREYKKIQDNMIEYEKNIKTITEEREEKTLNNQLSFGNKKLEEHKELLFWSPNKNVREFGNAKCLRSNSLPSMHFKS